MNEMQILKRLYNAFDPTRPLEANDPVYTDCREARGDVDILQGVGQPILWSDKPTCQLYAGHRGAGKSTELLKLRKHLQDNDYHVVYFAADEADIDPEDACYTDILLACTRHILEALKSKANPSPLLDWLAQRWQSLKALATTEIEFDNLELEAQIGQFAKLSANLRAVPDMRYKIRQQVDVHTVSLLEALNTFITEAKQSIDNNLVVIADNLDRIVPVFDTATKRSNHDEIFLDRSEQLRGLACHVIYTVPISMVYSGVGIHLRDRYGTVEVLPVVRVRERHNQALNPAGVSTLKESIKKRVVGVTPKFSQVFEDKDTLLYLCLMSGGHMRNLVLLIRAALNYAGRLPISPQAAHRAVAEMRKTYHDTIFEHQWALLAQVFQSKHMPNDEEHRKLLFNRCILEYREIDAEQTITPWHDIHPLIEDLEPFQRALKHAT
jgi:hypothetical protein